MALPQLNVTPKYQLTIPSSGRKVSYRPYLVKEEKILLMAFESKETRSILRAMLETIGACVEEDIDLETLATFDVEYMFLQIRSKSVGETSTVMVPCSECKESNEVRVKIDDVKVDMSEAVDSTIEITKGVWVEMKHPTYADIIKSDAVDPEHEFNTDDIFGLLATSIVAIATEEERYDAKDQTAQELMTFIESLTSQQLQMLSAFLDNTPQLKKEVEFKCNGCGHDNNLSLSGMADFF